MFSVTRNTAGYGAERVSTDSRKDSVVVTLPDVNEKELKVN